jgi:putative MFS transporter
VFSILPNSIGRVRAGEIFGYGVAVTFVAAALLHSYFFAGISVFLLMLALNAFFNDGGFTSLSPYTAEIFPVRLAARGVGLAQAANGVGKILGPYCLAVVAGTGTVVSAQATEAAVLPAFLFLAGCGLVVGLCHTFFAPETRGRVLPLDDDTRTPTLGTTEEVSAT